MNIPDQETLRRILHKMHKQSEYEKFLEILPATHRGVKMRFNGDNVEFTIEISNCKFLLPMEKIYSVTREKENVYILCYNQKLHLINLKEQSHLLIPLHEQLSLWEMFILMCRTYYDKFQM